MTEQDFIILSKLAEKQKNQRPLKIKNRFSKQTRGIKLAGNLTPIIKKIKEVNESIKKLGEVPLKPLSEDENTQTRSMENVTGRQSLLDTFSFMKRSKNFFQRVEKPNGDIIWIGVCFKPLGENRFRIKYEEFNTTPVIQNSITITKATTKCMDDNDRSKIFDMLGKLCFYNMIDTKR